MDVVLLCIESDLSVFTAKLIFLSPGLPTPGARETETYVTVFY